ncbi:MAG TPA: hypothetical protein VFS33_00015 [Gemmatimonadales bacterium]|nr:hypothetical protein [Gemmatimonadales bacterium]
MFIELTDHLRCPADHAEQFLVLLPDAIEQRSVRAGRLGCPVCGRTYEVHEGIAELGGAPPVSGGGEPLSAEVMHVLLGLEGPGGYAVLCGSAAAQWRELAELLPGVALVAVNPPPEVADSPPVLSPVRAPIIPVKQRSMRGVVLSAEYAADPHWQAEAARVTLPGLRVVGRGPEPAIPGLELLASADGTWVAARR